jgi:hypothetical protein
MTAIAVIAHLPCTAMATGCIAVQKASRRCATACHHSSLSSSGDGNSRHGQGHSAYDESWHHGGCRRLTIRRATALTGSTQSIESRYIERSCQSWMVSSTSGTGWSTTCGCSRGRRARPATGDPSFRRHR